MVATLQEKDTFIGNTEIEKKVSREGKLKQGMFMIESRYYAQGEDDRRVYIVCGCGCRAYINRVDSNLDRIKKMEHTCTSCGNKEFLSHRSYVPSFVHFRDKETMFQLAAAGFYYKFNQLGLWNEEHQLDNENEIAIQAIPIRVVISTNKINGVTYQIQPDKNRIKNISRVGLVGEYEHGLLHAAFAQSVEYKEAMLTWQKRLRESLPLYLTKEWRIEQKPEENCGDILLKSRKLFLLHAYPYLSLMGRDVVFPLKRREERAMVKVAKKKIDIYRIAVPAISKSTLSLLEDPDYVNAFNVLETLGMIQNKDILRQAILSFHYEYSYFRDERHINLEIQETMFSRRVKKSFIRKFFQTNKNFDNRVVIKNNLLKTKANIEKIQDSILMYERIKREVKALSIEEQSIIEGLLTFASKESVTSLHDRLSTILGMIKRGNKTIDYNKTEINRWNRTLDTVDFRLVKDTHEMINVGEQMTICVGGYDEGAFAKEFLIVIGYVDEQPTICIQIMQGKIVQIKKKYNEFLSLFDGEKTKDMRRYINETGVMLDTHDFEYELEELPMSLRSHRNRFREEQQVFNRENAYIAPVVNPFEQPYRDDPFANYGNNFEVTEDNLPF